MSEYDDLHAQIRTATHALYIVNEKRPPLYDRQWRIYVVFKDGDTIAESTSHTEWTRDDVESRNSGMRKVLQMALFFLTDAAREVAGKDEQ